MFDLTVFDAFLKTEKLGRTPVILDEVDSTNDWLGKRLCDPRLAETIVIAHVQTNGRGRHGRVWSHLPGVGLAFSLAWGVLGQPRPMVTLATGIALAETVMELAPVDVQLKYPNDLLIAGKKVAGILTEVKGLNGRRAAIIGVGINVNVPLDNFPDNVREIATSILIEGGVKISREAILAIFLNRLEPMLVLLGDGCSGEEIVSLYKKLSGIIGRKIAVTASSGEIMGEVIDMDEDGGLIIDSGGGELKKIVAGETRFLD
ncbi:hypothetical protein MNBD_NITROSPINAE01-945 [hydrothermal vent metagenome]|uniref:BPL/LPL catalytic domain-containing protein n=1 Tax=hydrothermal vent metagenome TaxID=652676 RepID=A0A3B1CED3_9ZZZZ